MDYLAYLAVIILALVVVMSFLWALRNLFQKHWPFGAPFIRTKPEIIKRLIDNLDMKPGQVFLELGCGDGIVMAAVLEKFPGVMTRGYETVPKVCALSEDYQKQYGVNFDLRNTDFLKEDLSDADSIYFYLVTPLVKLAWAKIQKECKPGTKIYANMFPVPSVQYFEEICVPIDDGKVSVIYVYVL